MVAGLAGLTGCLPEPPYREEGRSATTDCPPKTP